MSENTASKALMHRDFQEVFNFLVKSLFLKNRKGRDLPSLSMESIRRATWLASLISLGDENERSIASSFGALLYLYDSKNELFLKACYVLQSRAGNIVSSKHLEGLYKNKNIINHFSVSLDLELTSQKVLLEKEFDGEETVYFTHFQKDLWRKLVDGDNVAVSAPTSAGKSFVIKKYIFEKITKNKDGVYVYIVPSKALINQVSNELSRELKKTASVLTTYRENTEEQGRIVFVLTPERCLRLLNESSNKSPIIVFFDEIQNLEDGSRGSVFENIIYRMTTLWKETQFIMAGPYISDLHLSLKKVVDIKLIEHKTLATPVLQLKVILSVLKRSQDVNYKLFGPVGEPISGSINIGKSLYSKLSSSKGDALKHLTSLFDDSEQNIIYAPKKNIAQGWALKISGADDEDNADNLHNDIENEKISNLCSFLESEIHPLYSLVRSIKKGVAFHHGGLLDVARLEVEDLFSEGVIKNLVCTSTLLQGVNLPADRIIILSPKIGDYELSHFDFLNLIGRAGRISNSLYGEIFCVELCDESWAEEKINKEEKKEIESSVLKKINDNAEKVVSYINLFGNDILSGEGDYKVYPLVSYLRSQFIVDRDHYEKILNNSNLNAEQTSLMDSRLEIVENNLTVPSELIAKNPFIDPLILDDLYFLIKREGVSSWIMNKYPSNKTGVSSQDVNFLEMNYYNQYKNIIVRLNHLFDIEREINFKEDGISIKSKYRVSIAKLAYDSHSWMLGKKYRFFIEDMVSNKFTKHGIPVDYKKIDSVTNFITSHINTNLTFILVKYLSVWSDVVSSFMKEDEKEEYAFFLNLPSMLEMGSYDSQVLEIMAFGINRSTAIELLRKKRIADGESVDSYLNSYDINKLSPLHKKYLARAGFGEMRS
ncbi:DEAD/DEAH box helicase [Chimaeribacter arupi]|uniref:DEAD/DEAH box helicase n=1 Tax=Chimaeribacter arupi TaxID=2060066 RepID=UPI002711F780|nr:DEAD/DEAH box helicase [Chimaeribacter arupi]WKZ93234.1 DEAD/DEAH box helicase [Chimaeribacter arupi]